MNVLVSIAFCTWPVMVLALFALLPPRRAVIVCLLCAWLFLPMARYTIVGFPDIDKMSITCVSVLVGMLCFDSGRLLTFRLRWVDTAMLTWVLVPFPSAVNAGYGAYEGVSGVLTQAVGWGLPYFLGRIYFDDVEDLRELALCVFVAGLVYVPFVLFEAKMSPQLHKVVYGYHQHAFSQTRRMGGWRPMVFMQHGLAVAMFMGTAGLCGLWLWAAGKMRCVRGIPTWALAIGLLTVAAACRSAYALILTCGGAAALFASRRLGTRAVIGALLAIPPLYVGARTVGGWDAQLLRDAGSSLGADRAESLRVRLDSEDALWTWVQGDLLLGRGRLSELMSAPRDEWGRFIPDGLWLIALGKNGAVGLVAMLSVVLLPIAVFLCRHRMLLLAHPRAAGATALMMTLLCSAWDGLLNAMVNPVYLAVAGGLTVCQVDAPVSGGGRPVPCCM